MVTIRLAFVGDTVAVAIMTEAVGNVAGVRSAVVIAIRLARITDPVCVAVGLIRVGYLGAVIAAIRDAISIGVCGLHRMDAPT